MTRERPPAELSPEEISLFLDIDGTLANFQRRPEEVGPTRRLRRLLEALAARLQGRVAMISGRALADIDRITERRIEAASGVHGLERRRADGSLDHAQPDPAIAEVRAQFERLIDAHPDLLLEDKGLGLVLHYRTAPDLEPLAQATAERLATDLGLALQRGDMMAEVRTAGRDKGHALKAFMGETPFSHGRPVYLGDDITDEDAFVAARDLGGFGVLVGLERTSAASYRLDDVEATLSWLEAFADVAVLRAAEGG